MYEKYFKRCIDIIVSIIGLIILFPIIVLVAIILTITNGGSPLFLQTRPGKNERLFRIIKFKTMNDAKDAEGKLLEDKVRLTPIGKVVRKTSVDEILQLINVLKGDMSLIGPRPLLPEYLELYDHFQRQRHEVRPGITGWAAVNGRNSIDWEKKLALDVYYVNNISFTLDIKILWLTLLKVLKSEGVNSANMSTAEPFKGNK